MTTDVIVRFDDIRGPDVAKLAEWFDRTHPEVPCSLFALATGTEWDERSWRAARDCIEERGWEIGGHTRSHPMLTQLTRDEIREEIRENIQDIESGLSAVGLDYDVETFAYPGGDYDERVIDVLEAEGIPNGLTFTDGFPYQSVDSVPPREERHRWGVTHNGSFEVGVWNDRFDRVAETDGLYVLGLHPTYWDNAILAPVRTYLNHDISRSYLRRNLRHGIKRDSRAERWEMLDEHLQYIKSTHDVRFTTFRACTEDD